MGMGVASFPIDDRRIARAYDREIAPLYHDRFASLIWRHLPPVDGALVLDVHPGYGRTTSALLERLDDSCHVIALEPCDFARGLIRSRLHAARRGQLSLEASQLGEIVARTAATYDLVVANVVGDRLTDIDEPLRGIASLTRPGGTLLATLPMAGTWGESEDLLRSVLGEMGLGPAAARVQEVSRGRPSGDDLADIVQDLGVGPHHFVVEQERFSLLFRSGSEFLSAPVVELGPLRQWQDAIGSDADHQEVFRRLSDTIDEYYDKRVFAVTVVTGIAVIRLPLAGADAQMAAEAAGAYWRQFPQLDAVFGANEQFEVDAPRFEAPESPSGTVEPAPLDGLMRTILHDEPAQATLKDLLDQVLED